MNSDKIRHRLIKNPNLTLAVQDGDQIVNVNAEHAFIDPAHNIADQYSSLGATNGVLQNSSIRLEFQIFSSRLNEYKFSFLEIPITNNDLVNDLELIPPIFWCNLIEILISNNSAQEIYSEGLWMAMRQMTDEQRLIMSRLSNMMYPDTMANRDVNLANPILVPAGTTRYVYLPLFNTLWEQTKVPFNSIKSSTIRYRFTFDVFSRVTATTNAMVTASNLVAGSVNLYILGSGLSSIGSTIVQSALLEGAHSYNYYKQERQILTNGNTIPGARINQSLTNLNGTYANIISFLRQLNPVGEQQFQFDYTAGTNPTFYAIENPTLKDSNGSPYSLTAESFLWAKWFPGCIDSANNSLAQYSTFPDYYSFVEYELCGDMWNSERRGHAGGIVVNNAWSLEYDVNSANTTDYLTPYPAITPFVAQNTETVTISSRLYALDLALGGRASFRAQ